MDIYGPYDIHSNSEHVIASIKKILAQSEQDTVMCKHEGFCEPYAYAYQMRGEIYRNTDPILRKHRRISSNPNEKFWEEIPLYRKFPQSNRRYVLMITTAYEQGVGKGHQAFKRKRKIDNPYLDGDTIDGDCFDAWQIGYDEGTKQAKDIEAKT